MANINERQISLRKGGRFTTLDAYLDKHLVHEVDENSNASQTFTLGSTVNYTTFANVTTVVPSEYRYALKPATPPSLTINELEAVDRGIPCGTAATIGTASASGIVKDSIGNTINLINIMDATTFSPVFNANDKQIYGLLQTTAANGAALTNANVQFSFVTYSTTTGSYALATLPAGDYVYTYMISRKARFDYDIQLERSADTAIATGSASTLTYNWQEYTVTTTAQSNETLTFGTNAADAPTFSGSGVATANTSATAKATMGASEAAFLATAQIRVYRNGVLQQKGTTGVGDVHWGSANSVLFEGILDNGDVLRFENHSIV